MVLPYDIHQIKEKALSTALSEGIPHAHIRLSPEGHSFCFLAPLSPEQTSIEDYDEWSTQSSVPIQMEIYDHEPNALFIHSVDCNASSGLQNIGVGKLLMQNLYRYAKQHNYKELEIVGLHKGSYAWAKYGFSPTPKEWNEVRDRVIDKLMLIYENHVVDINDAKQGNVHLLRREYDRETKRYEYKPLPLSAAQDSFQWPSIKEEIENGNIILDEHQHPNATLLRFEATKTSAQNRRNEAERLLNMIGDSSNPQDIWKIADSKLMGKECLMGEHWGGQIEFDDPKAVDRFESYCCHLSAEEKSTIADKIDAYYQQKYGGPTQTGDQTPDSQTDTQNMQLIGPVQESMRTQAL